MKKRKPFYNTGDMVQITTSGCQTEDNYCLKIALVLDVIERSKPYYEVRVLDYTGTSEWVHPGWDCPYEELNNDPSHIIIRQSHLRKLKVRKCKDCKVELGMDWTWARCPSCNEKHLRQVEIDNEIRYAKQRKQHKETI
jgi:hypothetical protein